MKHLLLSILAFLLLVTMVQGQSKNLLQQHYGPHPQNTLDLFLPQIYTRNTPVLILIHGGAWTMGGNEYTDKTSKDLRNRGFIVANVDYRYVSDSVHAADLLGDIDKALELVQKISAEYNFNNENYHLAGISAGAHLALLYGYTTKKNIKSITALCAPSRLDDPEMLNVLQKNHLVRNIELLADASLKPGQKPDPKFTAVSPYSKVKNIPTLLFHGDADQLVPYTQSVFLYDVLQQKNVKSKLITMKGKGHDVGMNQADSEKLILDELTAWVKLYN